MLLGRSANFASLDFLLRKTSLLLSTEKVLQVQDIDHLFLIERPGQTSHGIL